MDPPKINQLSNAVLAGRIIESLTESNVPANPSFLSDIPNFDADGQAYLHKLLSLYHETIVIMKNKLVAGMEEVNELKIKLVTRAEERDNLSEVMSTFTNTMDRISHPKPGSVTRSEAWEKFKSGRGLINGPEIPISTSTARKKLIKDLNTLAKKTFFNEIEMYPLVIKIIKSSLYKQGSLLHVVDTHSRRDLPVDITVAHFTDGTNLKSAVVRGQMLDNLRDSAAFQPWRAEVIGILSDLNEAWIYRGSNSPDGFQVTIAPAPTFADAILTAHERMKDLQDKLPDLPSDFGGQIDVLCASRDHYLYSASTTESRNEQQRIVVVKVAADSGHNLENEITYLKRFSASASPHKNIARYFWSSDDCSRLAITPKGRKITTMESATVSRSLIHGLIDGLEWLHVYERIVHRDIRLSNVIINNRNEAVIIDFQTAVDLNATEDIPFLGGRICWPPRLLSSYDKDKLYQPSAQDDLHAAILFVMHLLFPAQFDAFVVQNIMKRDASEQPTMETDILLNLWKNINTSPVLSQLVKAAEHYVYEELRSMTSLFCSPEMLPPSR